MNLVEGDSFPRPARPGWWGSGLTGPVFNEPVYDSRDGQGGYSAEINVGGKLIYGYNWNLRRVGV